MIKFLFLTIFLAGIASANVELSDWQVCFNQDNCHEVKTGTDLFKKFGNKYNKATYRTKFKLNGKCVSERSCSLFLGEVSDTAKVFFNGKKISSYDENSYIRHQSVVIQIPDGLIEKHNTLEVIVEDKNQNLFGLKSKKIFIDSYSSARLISIIDWVKRTGITLICSLTLFICFIALLIASIISPGPKSILLCIFSGTASLYLFSFSEIPREIFEPLYLSGPVHFSLLLLQALTLFLVVAKVFSLKKHSKLNTTISLIYATVIGSILISSSLGIDNFNYYKRIILFAAPLVSCPFIYLFIMSSNIINERERRIVRGVSMVFSLCIIGDTLTFWQVVNLGFTIKYLLPLTVILMIWVLLSRKAEFEKKKEKDYTIGKLTRQFLHDVKVDIDCFNNLFQTIKRKLSPKEAELVKFNIGSFYQSIQKISNDENFSNKEVFDFKQFGSLYESARIDYFKASGIEVKIDLVPSLINQSKNLFNQIFNNLIKNAVEAKSSTIEITSKVENNFVTVYFEDNGSGMDDITCENIFERFFTTKEKSGGQGLGLSKIKEAIELMGGEVDVVSDLGVGTIFKLSIPLAVDKLVLKDSEGNKDEKNLYSVILIDDDALVRTTWKIAAESRDIKCISYASSSEILSDIESLNKDANVYIDFNLDEESDGVKLAKKLFKFGFKNITLATAEDFSKESKKAIMELGIIKKIQGKEIPWIEN
ncbi:MAG: ATP-binding protein [Bacteriovoracaceae bacterium]|nr:ATP-binding protein [Bacteriovoracaceae bacterium]